jgi:hypothetical protein
MFQVKEQERVGNWVVVDEDDFVWGGYATQEDAQEAADKFKADEDARDYIRYVLFSQLVAPAGNDVLAGLSQNDVRDLIQEVADEGGY